MTVATWIHEGAAIGREKGNMDLTKILQFKDGVLVTEDENTILKCLAHKHIRYSAA